MRTCILTSMFQECFPEQLAQILRERIPVKARFAFVASEFELQHEKTDRYFRRFLELFTACGIVFHESCVVDGRMTPQAAQETVKAADVVWLSGGNTSVQYACFEKYGLLEVLRTHEGVVIGMSAGTINMAETAVCTRACGHDEQKIYPALGLVPFSVEPHFEKDVVSEELAALSQEREIYGLCDEAAIVYTDKTLVFVGDVFRVANGCTKQVSFS